VLYFGARKWECFLAEADNHKAAFNRNQMEGRAAVASARAAYTATIGGIYDELRDYSDCRVCSGGVRGHDGAWPSISIENMRAKRAHKTCAQNARTFRHKGQFSTYNHGAHTWDDAQRGTSIAAASGLF
jgi:hypothetical protein